MRLPGSVLQGILARAALVLLRIYLGMAFVMAARPMSLANAAVVPSLVTWGEILVGVTLVLGLTTRLSAALGLFLLGNSMFARGTGLWQPSNYEVALGFIAVALIIGAAGRTLGLDAQLAKRWPRSPFW